MGDEYTYTVPTDTIALESPVKDLRLLNLDTNTEEVLDVCGFVPDSEDQVEDYSIVLDSDDEGEQGEGANVVTRERVRGRDTIGSSKRPAGYFRRLGNKSSEHVVLQCDPTRSSRCDEESNATRTCLDNDSRDHDHGVVLDCVTSISLDKQRIPKSVGESYVNQENLKMVMQNLTKDSLDEKHLSETRGMESDAGYDLEKVKLNHDESTELVESQSKALDFVDHYLSLNDLVSFGDVEEAKQIDIIKSPPSLSSKGSLCLARRINLGCTESKFATFDWVANPFENGECTFSRTRKDPMFGFKGDKHEHLSVSKESDNVNVQNAQMDNQMDAFDVGLDTQIAAEAMEALINSPLPSFDAQHSGNKFNSSTVVYRRRRSKYSANAQDAFISWKNKCKRSKAVHISSVKQYDDVSCSTAREHKIWMGAAAQLPVSKNLITNTLLSGNEMIESNTTQKRRKLISGRDDVCKVGFSEKCLKSNSDSSSPVTADKGKEGNLDMDVANSSSILKLNMWVYPKGKRACLPRHSSRPDRHCFPFVPIRDENNAQKCRVLSEEANGKVKKECLVYARKRLCSSERKHSGSGSNVTGSPSLIPIEIDTAKPSNQLCELDDGHFSCSVNTCSIKLNEQSNGNSSTLQVFDGSDKRKYLCKQPFKSHLTKELLRLGYPKSLPDFLPKDSRRRRAMEKVRVLFSQNLDINILKKQKKIVARLEFSIASCCLDATHFVADRFVRTRNMMEAIALGKPVVTHLWLESCEQARCVIDEKSYILRDEKKEKEIGFSMSLTLSRASHHPLLKGRRAFVTTNVKPSVDVITCLVKAVHGQVAQNIQSAKSKDGKIAHDLLILSSEEDYTVCVPFLEKGASIYDSELLLNGIVTQKLDYERHQIFKDFGENRSFCVPQRRKNL